MNQLSVSPLATLTADTGISNDARPQGALIKCKRPDSNFQPNFAVENKDQRVVLVIQGTANVLRQSISSEPLRALSIVFPLSGERKRETCSNSAPASSDAAKALVIFLRFPSAILAYFAVASRRDQM